MKPNKIYPLNCRAAVYLIPLRWRPDYWPEEFPETRWKDLHPKKPPLCGESAPRYYRGRDEKVVWEVWQGRGSLHTQGQRLWFYQAGEWLGTFGEFFVVMAHTGAVLLIESSRCSDVLLIKPADDLCNLQYGMSFQVVCLELVMKRNVNLGSLWQELWEIW